MRASRRRAFCIVKEDGTETGRTHASDIVSTAGNTVNTTGKGSSASTTIGAPLPEMVSWEGGENPLDANLFAVTLSPHRGGGLPLQFTIELWETVVEGDNDRHTRGRRAALPGPTPAGDRARTSNTSIRRIGSARVGPDTLLLSLPGRLDLPLTNISPSTPPKGAIRGISQAARAGGQAAGAEQPATERTTGEVDDALPPKIVLRVTPQVGLHWGHRVRAAATVAKRVEAPLPLAASPSSAMATDCPTIGSRTSAATVLKNGSDGQAHVVYMTSAEGSARAWRAPVTPGSSIPREDYDDVLELVFGSVPACCPQAPTLLVAPVSDIGVQLGKAWIGPKIAARHAIVAHRPQQYKNDPSNIGNRGDEKHNEEGGTMSTSMGDIDGTAGPEPPREDELFMRVVAAEAEGLLRNLRARDMRTEQRRVALGRVREICETWTRARVKATPSQREAGSPVRGADEEREGRRGAFPFNGDQGTTDDGVDCDGDEEEHREAHNSSDAGHNDDNEADGVEEDEGEEGDGDHGEDIDLGGRAYGDLFRGVLRALEMALPGVSIYLGLLERGGDSIRYVACTKQSSMSGKRLRKGEGISFSCVGPHYAPYVVYPPRTSGVPKRGGNTRSTISQLKQPAEREQEGLTAHLVSASSSPLTTMVEVVNAATKGRLLSSQGIKKPQAERSLEEIVVSIQKVFRGKVSRDRVGRSQPLGASRDSMLSPVSRKVQNKSKTSALLIPKVFDYEGRVGWPFVCVPLEGFLRSSSIGVLGLDTFEQTENSGSGENQLEAGVVQMIKEAARYAGRIPCVVNRALSCAALIESIIRRVFATACSGTYAPGGVDAS